MAFCGIIERNINLLVAAHERPLALLALELKAMSDYTTISLSKNGKKNAGKYVAVVDSIDSDLGRLNWQAREDRTTVYAQRFVRQHPTRTTILLHRVILARKLERDELLPHEEVDHIDGNGLNNRRENLRLATQSENKRNRRKPVNSTSGLKGAYWHKATGMWSSAITVDGKAKYLGLFATAELAHQAYCEAAIEYHREFANFGED